DWAAACIDATVAIAVEWVEAACTAKRIPPRSHARAEEILVGPVALVRYLKLMIRALRDLKRHGSPQLPALPHYDEGQLRVQTFPTQHLYDALTLRPIKAETWLEPEVNPSAIFGNTANRLARCSIPSPHIGLVLGAGNVSAIPATDVLTSILQNDQSVLLKM